MHQQLPPSKLPIYFGISMFFSMVSLALLFGPFLVWGMRALTVKGPMDMTANHNLFFVICMLSGFILLYPSIEMNTLARDPTKFLTGNISRYFIPTVLGWALMTWFFTTDLIYRYIYSTGKINVKNPPEVVEKFLASYAKYSWILTGAVAASIFCFTFVGYALLQNYYRKRKMLRAKK